MIPSPAQQNPLPPITLQWPGRKKPKGIIKKNSQAQYLETLRSLEFQSPITAMASAGVPSGTELGVPTVAVGNYRGGPSSISTIHPASLSGVSSMTETSSVFSGQGAIPGNTKSSATKPTAPPFSFHKHNDGPDEYVLIFNRSSGNPRVHYLMIDPNHRGRLLPKVNFVTMAKVKDLVSYRVVQLDNFVYILGGRNLESGTCVSFCYRYDPRNNQWGRIANLIRGRCRFTATALDGYLYVVGGESKTGRIVDSVECYDPMTDCWTEMRPMPRPRADHAACVAEGRLFISGGIGEGKKSQGNNVFWQYEPRTDYWSQSYNKSVLPQGRERHTMVEHRGHIFIAGGLTWRRNERQVIQQENDKLVSFECNKGNIDTRIMGTWNESAPPTSHPRAMSGALVVGHNIFMIGGFNYTENKFVHTVEYYNTRKRKWYEGFSLGKDLNLNSVDIVVVKVPQSNRWFSHLTPAIQGKWTLW